MWICLCDPVATVAKQPFFKKIFSHIFCSLILWTRSSNKVCVEVICPASHWTVNWGSFDAWDDGIVGVWNHLEESSLPYLAVDAAVYWSQHLLGPLHVTWPVLADFMAAYMVATFTWWPKDRPASDACSWLQTSHCISRRQYCRRLCGDRVVNTRVLQKVWKMECTFHVLFEGPLYSLRSV